MKEMTLPKMGRLKDRPSFMWERTMNRTTIAVTAILLLPLAGGFADAQKGKPFRRTTTRAAKQAAQPQQGFTFGDITLRGYNEMKFVPGKSVVAEGPGTTVDSVDKETGARSQLLARNITATMGKAYAVEKVVATGNVRFNGSRPLGQNLGTQVFNGSGSRATYLKEQGRLLVDGPVNYYADQPVKFGDNQVGKQWIRGTASDAVYDEKGKTLVLAGNVKAKAFDPASMPPGQPADIIADRVTIDMSKSPYEYKLENNDPSTGQIRVPIKQQPKKEKP
jgi:hypothetical protein